MPAAFKVPQGIDSEFVQQQLLAAYGVVGAAEPHFDALVAAIERIGETAPDHVRRAIDALEIARGLFAAVVEEVVAQRIAEEAAKTTVPASPSDEDSLAKSVEALSSASKAQSTTTTESTGGYL